MGRTTRLARPAVFAAGLLLLVACGGTSGPETPDGLDLFNYRLSPAYSQWLVGAASRMADPDEIEGFRELKSDDEAEAFIEAFWEKRPGRLPGTLQTYRSVFESRSEEANRLYSEAGRSGSRSDRGMIYVLYGKPEESEFRDASMDDPRTVEVWTYAKETPVGLDGKAPERTYRFIDQGELTVFYRGQAARKPRRPKL